MIGIVTVIITQSELNSEAHLREIASGIYPNGNDPSAFQNAHGIQKYIADITSTYTCIPRNAARAAFIWHHAQEFEIVVETFYQSNLISCIEGIVRRLKSRLSQLGIKTNIIISLQSTGDAQTYIVGNSKSKILYIASRLQENFVAIIIALFAVVISGIWFTDFLQEAIVSLITLSLFSVWQIFTAWMNMKDHTVIWSLNEHKN